ncbi:hypothetical protein MASR2M79_05610 [Aminivibrio sp.]
MDTRMNAPLVRAFVPLAEMFGYATDLRSKTSGRATYSMQFDHYDPAAAEVAEKFSTADGRPVKQKKNHQGGIFTMAKENLSDQSPI